jgi:nucleoid-associated protein YgaU
MPGAATGVAGAAGAGMAAAAAATGSVAASPAASVAASVIPAYIQPITLPLPPIIFPFSPNQFTVAAQATARQHPQAGAFGSGQGNVAWHGVDPIKVDIDIKLDQFSIPPVPVQLTAMELGALLAPDPISQSAGMPGAPQVMFGWGANIIMLQAIITKVAIKYERFLLGIPVQATASITLWQIPSMLPLTNPTSGGLAARRTHKVVQGDNLALLAHKEYNDPSKWRAIAIANNIDDPMRLRPGSELLIPDRREADVLAA